MREGSIKALGTTLLLVGLTWAIAPIGALLGGAGGAAGLVTLGLVAGSVALAALGIAIRHLHARVRRPAAAMLLGIAGGMAMLAPIALARGGVFFAVYFAYGAFLTGRASRFLGDCKGDVIFSRQVLALP